MATSICLLGLGAQAGTSTLPIVVVPPNTNRYYINLVWESPGSNIAGYSLYIGVKSRTYTNKLSTTATNIAVSNLFGTNIYFFSVTAVDSSNLESDYSNELRFPPEQPPLTNFLLISCTGTLQVALLGLRGSWIDTTNRLFKLGPNDGSVFWRSKAREMVGISVSNNQVDYSWAIRKQ